MVTLRPWTLTVVAAMLTALYLFPVYWMYISALKTPEELEATLPTLWPHSPTLGAFRWVFARQNVGTLFLNSAVISVGTTALTMVTATGTAYGLARFRSLWMSGVLIGVTLSQALPPALMATPMFVIFRQTGLLNTQFAIILATTTKTLPFAIIMLRIMFAQVPSGIEEAARVDGCSRLGAFLRITVPLARGGYTVVGALVFLQSYGEFVYPFSLMNRVQLQPATVGLYSLAGPDYSDWSNAMAFASVFVTPVIIIFALLQRQIVSGLTAGALK